MPEQEKANIDAGKSINADSCQLDTVVIPQTELQYALLTKHRTPDIVILAKTRKELDESIDRLYWNKKRLSAKGSEFEMTDLIKDYVIAKIWIKPFAV